MSEVTRLFNESNNVPANVHVMLTTKCSLGCKGCFYRLEKEAVWSAEKAMKLVLEAQKLGVKWLALGGGEPAEWHDIAGLVSMAKAAGLKVAVTTNGVTKTLLLADAVHISHDHMHCGNMTWKQRTVIVAAAVKHYRTLGVPKIGINTLLTDAMKLTPGLLKSVDRVVLLLPKPVVNGYNWKKELERADKYCSKYTQVLIDSCLVELMGRQCWQGRNSMSFDAQGRVSACSNVKRRLKAKGIMDGWKKVRLTTDACPRDCIVRGAIGVQRQHTGLPSQG